MHRRRGQRRVCGGVSGASQSWRKELRSAASVWRVDRRLKDDSLCSLSLNGSEGRSSKVLVADASSAPVGSSATIRTVSASADERTWKW